MNISTDGARETSVLTNVGNRALDSELKPVETRTIQPELNHESSMLPNVGNPALDLETKSITVSILSASGIREAGWIGKSNPYCSVEMDSWKCVKKKTSCKERTSQPIWNEDLVVADYRVGQALVFKLWDKNKWPKSDDLLGTATLRSDEFLPNGTGEFPVELELCETGLTTKTTLKVSISMQSRATFEKRNSAASSSGPSEEVVPQTPPQTMHFNTISRRRLSSSSSGSSSNSSSSSSTSDDAAGVVKKQRSPSSSSNSPFVDI